MAKRRKNVADQREEYNRKEKKARYIGLKNLMKKYPRCAYDGEFYCDYSYEPWNPWQFVDFRFFHSKEKRYFTVSMRTLAFEAYQDIESKAVQQAANIYPPQECVVTKFHRSMMDQMRDDLREELICMQLDTPIFVSASIQVKDCGPVAVGLKVTVNKQFIDLDVIREFIHFFRYLGEPTKHGWLWKGEEVYVVPRKIYEKL